MCLLDQYPLNDGFVGFDGFLENLRVNTLKNYTTIKLKNCFSNFEAFFEGFFVHEVTFNLQKKINFNI